MADIFRKMQKIWPIFRWANWGLSDDLFTGVRNSFYYSNNMEVLEDANWIYPKQSPRWSQIDLWLRSSVWEVVASLFFNDSRYVFCQKQIFKVDFETSTATPLASWIWWLTNNTVHDAEIFNWYVYIATTTHLFRISQAASDGSWSLQANFVDMPLNSAWYHPLYASDIFLAVWNWEEVSKVTKEIPDQVQEWIKLQSDYFVKFLDELWWFIRVTASDWYYGSEILLWDKVSPVANEVIPMSWYDFKQSCIYNWYHYLLSDKWLGLMNGYQYYILKKNVEVQNYFPAVNWMLVYDDKLHFVTTDWIFIYWAKNKNYNDVLSLWSSSTENNRSPFALSTDWINLIYTEQMISDSDNKIHIYVYRYIKWEENWTDWVLYTMWYYGTSLSEIKQAVYIRLWYFLSSWTIKVSYRTEADVTWPDDTNWKWHELTPRWWLTTSSDARSPFATTFKLNCRFQRIQFKFEISSSSLTSVLPAKIYSADLYYNDMLD